MKLIKIRISKLLLLFMIIFNFNISVGHAMNLNLVDTTSYNEVTNINNIVILLDFADTNSFIGDELKARQLESAFNDFNDLDNDGMSDEDKTSLKSYIYDLTNSRTNVNSYIYPKATTTMGYKGVKAEFNKAYYNNITIGSSSEKDFIANIFDRVKNEIQLTDADLDKDNDGKIDSVTFIFSGIPSSGSSMLRPHKTEITQNNPTLKGKKLGKYNIIGEGSTNVNIYNKRLLSTMVHEYLHMLGYPDLYKDGQSAKAVGVWDIMGDTVITPQLPLAYSRNIYGKGNLKIQEITESGNYTLTSSSITNTKNTVAFKIKSKEYPNEYFMIEYRKNNKKWDNVLPGSGIIIYRINENINSQVGNNSNYGNHVYVFRPGEDIPNSGGGNIKDAFLASNVGRSSFGQGINNTGFNSNSIYFSNGQNSGIVISNIGTTDSDEITFKIEIPNNEIIGSGTVNDPYQIKNPRDLNLLSSYPDKNFILANDLDLKENEIKPIEYFGGNIDGRGYKISNMTINSTEDTTGLISTLEATGVLKNITFENIDVKSAGWTSGTIVGVNLGTIENIKVSGTLETTAQLSVGGIVGENSYGNIINSISTIEIKSLTDTNTYVGGISGNSYNNITKNNYFSGNIVSQPQNKVGGIFGRLVIDSINQNTTSTDNIWNKGKSNLDKGVGETIEMGLTLEDKEKGVISLELAKDIRLDKVSNIYSEELVKYNKQLQSLKHEVVSTNEEVIIIENNKAKAISGGEAKAVYKIRVGTNEINEEINVKVDFIKEDVNKDNKIDVLDLSMVSNYYNKIVDNQEVNSELDINNDDIIDIYDLVLITKKF